MALFTFAAVLGTNAIAHEPPTKSTAKIYYKGLLKHFQTLQNTDPKTQLKVYLYEVDKAEEKLKLIVKSQADYDASSLVAEMASYKSKAQEGKSADTNST